MEISRKLPLLLVIGFLLGCAGCGQVEPIDTSTDPISTSTAPRSSSTPQVAAQPTQTAIAEEESTPTPVPLERPQYSITAKLDYENHRLIGEERILIPHPTDQVLSELNLVVPPNSWPGVFSLLDLKSGELAIEGYTLDGIILNISLATPDGCQVRPSSCKSNSSWIFPSRMPGKVMVLLHLVILPCRPTL